MTRKRVILLIAAFVSIYAIIALAINIAKVSQSYPYQVQTSGSQITETTGSPANFQTNNLMATQSAENSRCTSKNGLPDPICTPGAIDPRVTQDSIDQTICKSGYTTRVRPSSSYTTALKIKQIGQYGYSDTDIKDYEEDHLISLELGGAPSDPKNLWPEFGNIPNPKDKIENLCHKMVCIGQISLEEAQKGMATNWHTACGSTNTLDSESSVIASPQIQAIPVMPLVP